MLGPAELGLCSLVFVKLGQAWLGLAWLKFEKVSVGAVETAGAHVTPIMVPRVAPISLPCYPHDNPVLPLFYLRVTHVLPPCYPHVTPTLPTCHPRAVPMSPMLPFCCYPHDIPV